MVTKVTNFMVLFSNSSAHFHQVKARHLTDARGNTAQLWEQWNRKNEDSEGNS